MADRIHDTFAAAPALFDTWITLRIAVPIGFEADVCLYHAPKPRKRAT
jgi:hypothetical protein